MDRKRANKRQRELLVERLHANLEFARANIADAQIIKFWAELAMELNQLGCQRTVQEWQHVWDVWRGKVKTRARKIRDSIRGTGGGPAMPELSEIDIKILEIAGTASVYSFADLEQGLALEPAVKVEVQESPVVPPKQPQQVPRNHQSLRGRARRLRRPRPPHQSVSDNLVAVLRENDRLMRETIQTTTSSFVAALSDFGDKIVRAAEIMATAMSSLRNVSQQETFE